mmetsp:Transcript_35424/g.70288  ORF Transcript_35424/g.70288 Transcript_35424/m.70288 type:complete len:292 (-) Transcript_35424:340-1215(-)
MVFQFAEGPRQLRVKNRIQARQRRGARTLTRSILIVPLRHQQVLPERLLPKRRVDNDGDQKQVEHHDKAEPGGRDGFDDARQSLVDVHDIQEHEGEVLGAVEAEDGEALQNHVVAEHGPAHHRFVRHAVPPLQALPVPARHQHGVANAHQRPRQVDEAKSADVEQRDGREVRAVDDAAHDVEEEGREPRRERLQVDPLARLQSQPVLPQRLLVLLDQDGHFGAPHVEHDHKVANEVREAQRERQEQRVDLEGAQVSRDHVIHVVVLDPAVGAAQRGGGPRERGGAHEHVQV